MKSRTTPFLLRASSCIFLLTFPLVARGQVAANLNAFKVWLEVANNSILPALPIQAVLHIKNSSSSPTTVNVSPEVHISFKMNDGPWKPYQADGVPVPSPSPPMSVRFSPGQQLDYAVYVDSTSAEFGGNLTANPGIVQVRASWGPFQTEPSTITVLQPNGEDLAASQELKASGLSKFFRTDFVDRYLESDQSREWGRALAKNANDNAYRDRIEKEQEEGVAKSTSSENELRSFISKYSGSAYAKYARLALAQMALRGTSGTPDTKRAREILTDMRNRNELFTEATRSLAQVEAKEGNLTQAAAYFQEAAEKGTSPYYRVLAKREAEHLRNRAAKMSQN
jgi:hypothetical protein